MSDIEKPISPAVSGAANCSPRDWREQAQIHLDLASAANAKGHAGTWSREMHLAEMCMEQERSLSANAPVSDGATKDL